MQDYLLELSSEIIPILIIGILAIGIKEKKRGLILSLIAYRSFHNRNSCFSSDYLLYSYGCSSIKPKAHNYNCNFCLYCTYLYCLL